MNRREAAIFGGSQDLERVAARALARLAPRALVIVRDGADGCIVAGTQTGLTIRIRAPRVRSLDSTGAGDTHTGVFIAALAAGRDPLAAARRANAAAALSVTRRGPATAPTSAELDAFLEEHTPPA
jgi:sugar/nucleoside kinase (ribokinase family)